MKQLAPTINGPLSTAPGSTTALRCTAISLAMMKSCAGRLASSSRTSVADCEVSCQGASAAHRASGEAANAAM